MNFSALSPRKPYRTLVAVALLLSFLAVSDTFAANNQITIISASATNYYTNIITADAFDNVMRTYATNGTTAIINSGTYQTMGVWDGSVTNPLTSPGFRVQNNTRIYGTNTDGNKPTLKLAGAKLQGLLTENIVIATTSDTNSLIGNIQVTNLVLDCNSSNLFRNAYPMLLRGVNIQATNVQLIGLDVINASHGRTNINQTNLTENFIIALTCPDVPGLISTNNLIKSCTVRDFFNTNGLGLCSAISLNKFPGGSNYSNGYISGRVEDCAVTLHGYGGEFAYNAARTVSCVWSNNTATNAQRFFNNDTPYNHNVVFQKNNMVIPPYSYGLYLLNDTCWGRVYENTVKCDMFGQGVWVVSGAQAANRFNGCTNLMFDHNTITVTTNNGRYTYGFSLQPEYIYTATHVNVENNTVDSLLTNVAPTSVGYYVRNTNGTGFPAGNAFGVNLGWRYTPCRADLNQDAYLDIILQDASTNLAAIFMTNGTPWIQTNLTPSSLPGLWKVVGSGDIDRDGRTDLILQDGATLDIGYWLMKDTYQTGAGLLGSRYNPGGTWHVVATGDFDNDNKLDLLFQDAGGNLGIWLLNGTSYVSGTPTSPSNPGANWIAVGTGDFNNDAYEDILFQKTGSPYDGQLQVWFMNGTNWVSSGYLNPDGTNQPNMRVAATGVFGSSGGSPAWHTDILFQDRTNGALQMWYMNGTNRVATNSFGAPANSFKVVAPR
jgi:hypothetical protein